MANEISLENTDRGIRTYVLRAGRMTEGQKHALEEIGPRFIIPYSPGSYLDMEAIYSNDRPIVAEIGFGMGQATWQIALANPQTNYLGIEVHTPGVGKLLAEIVEHDLRNIRIIHQDAIEFLEHAVKPLSFAGFHIFYPDPWPKKRHQKRRLLRPGLIELLVSRLAPGGYLYFVTDIEEYASSSLNLLSTTSGLRNRYDGFAPRQSWRPETKFEHRASIVGREAWELFFERF